jgi:nucleoside-diphosphate-sugar epimerase
MQRDFTYIDDIVEGVVRVIDNLPVRQYRLERHGAGSFIFACSLQNL